jgi:DNA-binding MarR family transcriptional regulator
VLAVERSRRELLEALVRATVQTSVQTAAFSQAAAVQLGISPTDLESLALLNELGPTSAGQLAEGLGLTTGAITGVVDRLAAAGFVVRDSDPNDRRRVIVKPVAERMTAVEQAYAPLVFAAEADLPTYSDADLRLVHGFLQRADRWMQEQTMRIKAEMAGAARASELRAPLGDATQGFLEFSTGAAELRIGGSYRADELYQASFEGPQPSVRVQGGSVTFRYRRMSLLDFSKHSGTVGLNASIPWRIALRGGASNVIVDARDWRLLELSIGGGASKLEVFLPEPVGTVRVCVDGGVNRVQIERPVGVPAQLQVHGGANRLEFDDQRFGAVGGAVRLASPGWEVASDRYDIEVRGGASRLGLHHVQEVLSGAHAE